MNETRESDIQLTTEEEEELFASLQQIRSGEYEDGYDLLRELKRIARPGSQQ
jgi:hypothetical protein